MRHHDDGVWELLPLASSVPVDCSSMICSPVIVHLFLHMKWCPPDIQSHLPTKHTQNQMFFLAQQWKSLCKCLLSESNNDWTVMKKNGLYLAYRACLKVELEIRPCWDHHCGENTHSSRENDSKQLPQQKETTTKKTTVNLKYGPLMLIHGDCLPAAIFFNSFFYEGSYVYDYQQMTEDLQEVSVWETLRACSRCSRQ